eukprot:TRINITY_DN38552_c0_g1_i1.p1 TRINITY_DN38552_c0_g1~~TRINITY_DN38552_c0_g1_i1.p1  ORF type:complete len:406 (-),score=58.03 TRINITY_DN38552_c0_g1_i1:32-1249(-)
MRRFLFQFLNVFTDVANCLAFFNSGQTLYGLLTFSLIALPILIFPFSDNSPLVEWGAESLCNQIIFFIMYPVISLAWFFYRSFEVYISSFRTKHETVRFCTGKFIEVVCDSIPQIFLQTYIILRQSISTNGDDLLRYSYITWTAMILSLISAGMTSSRIFSQWLLRRFQDPVALPRRNISERIMQSLQNFFRLLPVKICVWFIHVIEFSARAITIAGLAFMINLWWIVFAFGDLVLRFLIELMVKRFKMSNVAILRVLSAVVADSAWQNNSIAKIVAVFITTVETVMVITLIEVIEFYRSRNAPFATRAMIIPMPHRKPLTTLLSVLTGVKILGMLVMSMSVEKRAKQKLRMPSNDVFSTTARMESGVILAIREVQVQIDTAKTDQTQDISRGPETNAQVTSTGI